MYVAAGGEAIKTIVIHNRGAVAVDQVRLRAVLPVFHPAGSGPFQTLDPGPCSDMSEIFISLGGSPHFSWHLQTDVSDLAPGERRICRYRYRRSVEIVNDQLLFWRVVEPANNDVPPMSGAEYVIGDLANLRLSVAPVCTSNPEPGQVQARVSVTNHGPTAIDPLGFGSCVDNFVPAFLINGEFDGGCGADTGGFQSCFSSSLGWTIPGLAAGQSHHCELRLTELPKRRGRLRTWPINLGESYYAADDWRLVLDIDPTTAMSALDFDALQAACQASGGAPRPVPLLPPWAFLILTGGLLTLAARRRSRGRR